MTKKRTNLSAEDKERLRSMMLTYAELRLIDIRRDYKVLRDRHFRSSIPPVEEVGFIFVKDEVLCELGAEEEGYGAAISMPPKVPVVYLIVLNENADISQIRFTMIHEMAHIKVNLEHGRNMGHGKKWQAEMKHLAQQGAFDNWW